MPRGLTLLLPHDLEPKERYWLCTTCGAKFRLEHEARWERHVIKCAKKNFEHIEAHIHGQRSNVFQSPADEELYRHVRRGGT